MILIYTAIAMQIPLLLFVFVIRLLIRKKVQILSCMECQRCTGACPVVKKHPEFIGPYGLMSAVKKERYDLVSQGHLEFCTQCGLCARACPRNLDALEEVKNLIPNKPDKKDQGIEGVIPFGRKKT
jgi:heterodisulfide reductase subunit C